jgi:hypothetical protein
LSEKACDKQKLIKKYISTIEGFKSVELFERGENYGALKNSKAARDEIFTNHESLIRTEDDNIFSPYFLSYMNSGLDYFKYDKSIFSICGYLEPIISGAEHAFLRQGFTSNGFGIWKEKYLNMESSQLSIKDEDLSFLNFNKMIKAMGYHVVSGMIYSEKMDYKLMDYYICYYLYKSSMQCVFPKKTLVRNIGQDGSGLHSGINDKLQRQSIHMDDVSIDENVSACLLADSAIYDYHKRSFIHSLYQYKKFIELLNE